MTVAAMNPMQFFPYRPRPFQDRAVTLAAQVFSVGGVGFLSADCGVGKTIAVLAGYLAARAHDTMCRLIVLTRTHSQSRVFESELEVLRQRFPSLTATTLLSRVHTCPLKEQIRPLSSMGFVKACVMMVKSGQCTCYWNFYRKQEGRPHVREQVRSTISETLGSGVITRERVETVAGTGDLCPYELMKHCARDSHIVIGPYSYLFRSRVRDATLGFLGSTLPEVDVLVDEAHNLPSHILDSETAKIGWEDLRWLREHRAEVVRETSTPWLGDTVEFLWETMMVALDDMKGRSEKQLDKWDVAPRFIEEGVVKQLMNAASPIMGDPDAASFAETPLDRLLEFLLAATRAAKSNDWHIMIKKRGQLYEEESRSDADLFIRPMNSAGLAAPVLREARSALLMSGTLRPLEHYSKLLGVSNALMADLASPYPRGTRLVLVDKGITTKYQARNDELWRTIADTIRTVLEVMPANKSALIAFPSYAIMREVLSHDVHTGHRRPLMESPEERIETVAEAIQSGPHAVFCVYGGKFSEGVDLAQGGSSMVDLIIGVGIPFTPPSSYLKAVQQWFDDRFGQGMGYYYASVIPSIRQVAQLLGRLRRSPADWGVSVLLDRRFLRFTSVFSEDMVSDMWPYEGPEELRYAIGHFIKAREEKGIDAP